MNWKSDTKRNCTVQILRRQLKAKKNQEDKIVSNQTIDKGFSLKYVLAILVCAIIILGLLPVKISAAGVLIYNP